MLFRIYYNNGVYLLDKHRGKGKIYQIINQSNPVNVDKLFSKKAYAHVPSGTYEFYIKDYSLQVYWTINAIYDLLELLERCINHNCNLLMTIDHEGPCSYVVIIPLEDDNIRLVILDRKNYKVRYSCLDDDRDSELERTIPIVDIIISRYEFIKQFNHEFHRIYNENKYYLSEDYRLKCEAQHASVCQEYVLKSFEEYMPIFDKYLENPEKFWKESFFSIERWNAKTYKKIPELQGLFNEWKKYGLLIGNKLEKIMVMGRIFNDERPYYTKKNDKWYAHVWNSETGYVEDKVGPMFDTSRTENVSLTLDEPISLFIRNDEDIVQHIDIDFTNTGRFMMIPNSFDFWEKSAVMGCIAWQDVSKYFSKNIIGHKIINIELYSFIPNKNDIDMVSFVMDNGYELRLDADPITRYLVISEN